MKKFGVIALVAVVLGAIVIGMWISYANGEVSLRNEANAQQKVCQLSHDTMWKIITQKAQVSETAADKFKEVFTEMMSARYSSGGGTLAKFIREQNPSYDMSLFADLSRSIEAERTKYLKAQERLVDVKREHDDMRTRMPGSWFVGGRPELVIVLVTSSATDNAYGTGKDDETKLFKDKGK